MQGPREKCVLAFFILFLREALNETFGIERLY